MSFVSFLLANIFGSFLFDSPSIVNTNFNVKWIVLNYIAIRVSAIIDIDSENQPS